MNSVLLSTPCGILGKRGEALVVVRSGLSDADGLFARGKRRRRIRVSGASKIAQAKGER